MNKGKHLWTIVMIAVLTSAMLAACGKGEPDTPTPAPVTPQPVATPTPSADDHMDRGTEYAEQGAYEEAIAEFERAIELEPDNPDAHRNLGTAHGELLQWEEAATAYEQAIELDPAFGEAYGDLVGAYFYLGRIPEALEAGEKAVELAPDYATAHNNLGAVYAEQGRLDEAAAEWNKAIELEPDNAMPYNNLGIYYANQGMLDQAIAKHKEAIEVDPTYAPAHYSLGLAYAKQDRSDEAIAEFEIYLQLRPDAPDRATVEGWIAELEGQGAEYVNAEGGYGLRYPEGWYYSEDGTRVGLAESQKAYEAPSLESPLVTLLAMPLAQTAQNFGLAETAAPTEFLQVMTGRVEAQVAEMESVQIAGYPAAVAATSGTVMDSPYRGNMIIILVEDRVFLAEAIAPPDQWDAFRPTFVDMVNSLAFFEPEG